MDDIEALAKRVNSVLLESFGQGAAGFSNNFEWLALIESVRLIKIATDSGVGDIEKLAQSAHQGWCNTVRADSDNQLDLDTPTTAERKHKRMAMTMIPYEHFPDQEKERYRLMARTILNS
jgi:hypothetical protein